MLRPVASPAAKMCGAVVFRYSSTTIRPLKVSTSAASRPRPSRLAGQPTAAKTASTSTEAGAAVLGVTQTKAGRRLFNRFGLRAQTEDDASLLVGFAHCLCDVLVGLRQQARRKLQQRYFSAEVAKIGRQLAPGVRSTNDRDSLGKLVEVEDVVVGEREIAARDTEFASLATDADDESVPVESASVGRDRGVRIAEAAPGRCLRPRKLRPIRAPGGFPCAPRRHWRCGRRCRRRRPGRWWADGRAARSDPSLWPRAAGARREPVSAPEAALRSMPRRPDGLSRASTVSAPSSWLFIAENRPAGPPPITTTRTIVLSNEVMKDVDCNNRTALRVRILRCSKCSSRLCAETDAPAPGVTFCPSTCAVDTH